MAESMYDIIDRGTMVVEHGPHKIEIELPWCLRRFAGKLDDDEKLLDEEALLTRAERIGLLHSALASEIIQVRAIPRQIAGEIEGPNGKMVKAPFAGHETTIRTRLEEYNFTPKRRPGKATGVKKAFTSLVEELQDAVSRGAGPEEFAAITAKYAK